MLLLVVRVTDAVGQTLELAVDSELHDGDMVCVRDIDGDLLGDNELDPLSSEVLDALLAAE